jgi:5-methylcytosine-specific restriction endonuclease McrA
MSGDESSIAPLRCKQCQMVLGPRNTSGLCLPCYKRLWAQQHYTQHADSHLAYQRAYRATNPDKWRAYHRMRDASPSRRERKRITDKQRRDAHREAVNAYARTYRKAHPEVKRADSKRRKALKKGATISDFTHAQWIAMQAHYDHRCVYCGKRAKGQLTQDHITPLSKGGNHTASNIVPACTPCNSRKQAGSVLQPIQPVLLLC